MLKPATVTALSAAAIAIAFACPPARALEPFKTYDNFTAAGINPDLWNEWERSRSVKKGALNLLQRSWGLNTADTGSSFYLFNTNIANPVPVTELRAKVTVNALEVNACATNAAIGGSRARIIGSFFNVGTPVAGSELGDVLAQVRFNRFSNSLDAAGVLRVQGVAFVCDDAQCLTSTLIGSVVDLGTVNVGQAATVQLQWDKANKQFLFGRDAGAFSGAVAYTQSDADAPGLPFAQVSTRTDIPSCLAGPRVTGYVDATFDNVAVNKSAAP